MSRKRTSPWASFIIIGFREYEQALTEFQRAIELQPNNSLFRAPVCRLRCTGGDIQEREEANC